MPRKSAAATVSAKVVELRDAAIDAVRGIESSYGAASSAILAYTLACKGAEVPQPVFDAGLARIIDAAPGLARISVKGYASNARRIWQCDVYKLAEVTKKVSGLQSIAKACPAVVKAKAEGAKAREAGKAEAKAPTTPSAPVVTSPAVDPTLAIANALVQLRKANSNKRAVLRLVGEFEDLLDELKATIAKAA